MFTCEVKTVDVGEVNVSRTFGRTAVVQKFPDFVAAFSHLLKPFARNGSQFAGMCFHSAIDGGIALDGAVEDHLACIGGVSYELLAKEIDIGLCRVWRVRRTKAS
jgi:hypothetical protein